MLAVTIGQDDKKLLLYGSVISSGSASSEHLSAYKVVFEIFSAEHLKLLESFGGIIICNSCFHIIEYADTNPDHRINTEFAARCKMHGGVAFSVDSVSEDQYGMLAVCSCTPLDEYKQIMEI